MSIVTSFWRWLVSLVRRRRFIGQGGGTVVTPPVLNPPVNSILPLITGTPTEGQSLTVSNGTWTNSPTSYARQWKRDGAAISGATGSTYVLVTADAGKTITCTIIATNADGFGTATSLGVGPIAALDTTPDAFSFTDASNVSLSSTQTSNTITVAGLGSGVSVAATVTGGTMSKNGGAYGSTATTAVNGDTFAVRHTSSASNSTATDTTLTIGGVSDTFTSTTLAAVGGTLAAPTLGYPSGGTISVTIPPDWQSGDVLKLARSSVEAMTSPTITTHTLVDADTPGSSVSMGVPAGTYYFQAYGAHSGADSVNLSNIVKQGDAVAPTISTSSTQSQMELFALAISLTANETVSWSIIGGADQTQFDISGSTLRWFGNGTANYDVPTDIDQNNTYVVTVRATDLGGNTTDKTITTTVTQADKTPDAYSFTNVIPATPSTQYTSNTITVAGLTSGLSVPVTVAGGATYSKNGGAYTSAAGTAVNGDTFALRVTSGSGATDVLGLSLHIGLGAANWTVSNTSNTAAWSTTTGVNKQVDMVISGANNLQADANDFAGKPCFVRANQGASGKRVWEFKVTEAPGASKALCIGVDDGVGDFNATTPVIPGNQNNAGVILMLYTSSFLIGKNSVYNTQSGALTTSLNDVIRVECDTTPGGASNTLAFFKNGTQIGTTITGLGTITTTAYAFTGTEGNNTGGGLANFGATAFAGTPTSGFLGYGN